uniref:Proline rich 12 n=1 Tax=Hucho hucho TaxID=62062 RepID=A0A4W5N8T1_9TELE
MIVFVVPSGLSGLFETGLHHASPSGPDASVMNLISALESQRGPQAPPSASSLLSQFRTPSWQTAIHTPAPAELFISGPLPGSGSFTSSSALSAYQHPASFSSRSFPTLQDTPTFNSTSNGLLSPHDPLLHIKGPSQSSLGFDRLLSSQGAATAYRGGQDPTGASSAQASSARHLQSHQFNLLSSQLQDQSSQLYNASVFSSAQAQAQSNSIQERAVPRQDSVIKHYQRPTPSQSQLSSSAAHSLQHYLSCGGAGYQQIAHHRQAGLSCSPLGDQSPSSDHKASSRTEQVYRPIIQPPYSISTSSSAAGKGAKSNSSNGYSSTSSASSSRTPHTPPSASSSSSTTTSSSSASGAHPSNSLPPSSSSSAPSRQQPPPQSTPAPQQQPPPTSSTSVQQPLPKHSLSGYGSPVPPVKTPATALTGQTPPQQQNQSYSPSQPPPSHLPQSYGGFSSPQAQDLSSAGGRKGYGTLGGRSQSYSADVVYGADSAYGSVPSSLGGAGCPSLGYGPGHSPALLQSSGSSVGGTSGGGGSSTAGSGNSGSGGAGSSMANERGGGARVGSYHIPESSPSPLANSGIIRPGLHSPTPACPTQSPGGTGSNKYISSVLSPTFISSPQGYPDTRGPQSQSYHPTANKTKSDSSRMLGVGSQRSQEDVDDDDDFLIQHLLQAQASPTPQASHHHSQQQQPQQTAQQAPLQPVPSTTDGGKGLSSYELGKSPEERYHLQSVIRTHSATSSAGAGSGGAVTGLDSQLEMSLKKQQHQQQRNDSEGGGRSGGGGRGGAEQSHPHLHHHDSLGSVVHYGRSDPYSQHSLGPQHSSHAQQQHAASHTHLQSHAHMELQKNPQERSELVYPRKNPDVQQQQHSQSSASLLDSPTDQSHQPPHLLQSVLSHTTRNKMEQHSVSQQQAMIDGTGGRMGAGKHQSQTQQASQLQLQLQSQALEVAAVAAHYNHGPPRQDQSQSKQRQQSSVVSSLDMLERSLSQTSSADGGGVEERRGGGGGGAGGRSGGSGEHDRQQQQEQQRLSSHHPQHSASELHSFLSEPDMGLSAPLHVHHLTQHHQHPNSHHQQSHSGHHPHSHGHAHPQAHTHPQPLPSTHSQQQESQSHPSQLTPGQQVQMDQHQRTEQHPFDTVSPVEKSCGQSQNRFVTLTSICFPDSLLQDEDRSFFPGMEDMFCSDDFSKSSCAGGAGPVQEEMNQEGPGGGHEEPMKDNSGGGSGGGSGGAGYEMLGDQGYGQYCHRLSESGNRTLDLDSLKTHELPSTVNTAQLGLIQSSSPGGCTGGTGAGPGGLTSPIFCSSRPKKLLKSSSFHLLKERRDPNTLPKKSYAQEYEFEDDEDKDNQPADIRLNSRRLPDHLPDLVSSCRKTGGGGGAGGGGTLSPLMGDLDFYHSGYPSLCPPPQLLPQDGPKKRGRKPTKPKRAGPPRPRGRPRIRPQPEQHAPRGMMGGEMGGGTEAGSGYGGGIEVKRSRGRGGGGGGRGRGRRDDMFMEITGKEQMQQHHLNRQQHQLHHQAPLPQHQVPIPHLKIKLPIGSMSSSEALLRTDSLSGTDPALSDGSVGSAPSLGLSPGPLCEGVDSRTQDKSKQKSQIQSDGVDGEGMDGRGNEKSGCMASFMDFLKSGKRPPGLEMQSGNSDASPLKSEGLCPLSPAPPPTLPSFGEGKSNSGLGGCPSPCKRTLDDELKRNLETLPSFSSDEEDSVGKNQDLQKSISSAISALYDTPQLASLQPPPPSPPPQSQDQPSQAPLTPTTLQPPALSPQPPSHNPDTQPQAAEPAVLQREDQEMEENDDEEEEERKMRGGRDNESEVKDMEEEEPELEILGAPRLEASEPVAPVGPSPLSASPAQSFSPSPPPSPLLLLSLPSSPLPPQEAAQQQKQSQPPSPHPPSIPSLPPAPATLPPSSQTPPASDSPEPSLEPPASPEDTPAPQVTSLHVAQKQENAAIAGESEDDKSESGGEGIFRERDEFVVRVEDIGTMKLALKTGREPPPIWRVQKALLQKFSPEIKNGQRQFCATSNYLGYFGDAKRRYQRLYVKFLENINKKDYVRVCSRRPWHRPSGLRQQALPKMASPPLTTQTPPRAEKEEREQRVAPAREPVQREPRERTRAKNEQREKEKAAAVVKEEWEKEKQREKEKRVQPSQKPEKRAATVATTERGKGKEKKGGVEKGKKVERPPKSKPAKVKAEPLPKKRKWLKEVPSSSDSDSSEEAASEDEMTMQGGVNNRAMREMFRSYVEMLVSTALDPDMIQALEDTEDELYLPGMRKIDGIIVEQKRRLMRRVNMSTQHQETLHMYPQMAVDPLDSGAVWMRLSGEGYNRKTLNRVKKSLPKPQDLKLSTESCRIYSLYHSLHHYKYHTFLLCKKETNTIEQAAEDPGQEEVVQQCMANQSWLDTLFNSFIELLTLSAKA